MAPSPLDLHTPLRPLAALRAPSHLLAPAQCPPGYELLTALLTCVMHRELSQENHDESQD
jgi:hypothetical protein